MSELNFLRNHAVTPLSHIMALSFEKKGFAKCTSMTIADYPSNVRHGERTGDGYAYK